MHIIAGAALRCAAMRCTQVTYSLPFFSQPAGIEESGRAHRPTVPCLALSAKQNVYAGQGRVHTATRGCVVMGEAASHTHCADRLVRGRGGWYSICQRWGRVSPCFGLGGRGWCGFGLLDGWMDGVGIVVHMHLFL